MEATTTSQTLYLVWVNDRPELFTATAGKAFGFADRSHDEGHSVWVERLTHPVDAVAALVLYPWL